MADFMEALVEKITNLEGQRDALTEQLANIDARLEVLRELLNEETGTEIVASTKKVGRPKGSKSKPKEDFSHPSELSEAAMGDAAGMEGTPPEVAERLSKKRVVRTAPPATNYGPGVRVDQSSRKRGTTSISIDDNLPVEETV